MWNQHIHPVYSILYQSLFIKNVNNNRVKRRHINHQQTQTKNFKTALSFSHLPNIQVYHIPCHRTVESGTDKSWNGLTALAGFG